MSSWHLPFFYPSDPCPSLALTPKSLLNYSLFSSLPLPRSSLSCHSLPLAWTTAAASWLVLQPPLCHPPVFIIVHSQWSSSFLCSDFPPAFMLKTTPRFEASLLSYHMLPFCFPLCFADVKITDIFI